MRSETTRNRSRKANKARVALAAIGIVVVVSLGILASQAGALEPMGAYDLLITPASIIRTLAGDCANNLTNPVCKEVCLVTMEGHIIPQNRFLCTPAD